MSKKKSDEPELRTLITIKIYDQHSETKIEGFDQVRWARIAQAIEGISHEYNRLKAIAVQEARKKTRETELANG